MACRAPPDTIAGGEIATSMGHKTKMLWQVAASVVGAAVSWRYKVDLWETEFSGGSVTGPMLELKVIGDLLLVVAVPVTFGETDLSTTVMVAGPGVVEDVIVAT